MPLKLEKRNLSIFHRKIPLQDLPDTFRDAVWTTWRLGCKFLWIDALCIIQDSQRDWEAESREMGRIFNFASVVLAAVDGVNPSSGLLPREASPAEMGNLTINATVRWAPQELHMNSTKLVLQRGLQSDDYGTRIPGPWNNRGWTMQEEALSRRIIYFRNSRCSWSCKEASWEEDGTTGSGDQHSFAGFGGPVGSHDNKWCRMVQKYSQRALTVSSDRLIAVEGMARLFGDLLGRQQQDYIYGLWKEDLPSTLAWRTNAQPGIDNASGALVPTWSWAAMNTPVYWDMEPNLISQRSYFEVDPGAFSLKITGSFVSATYVTSLQLGTWTRLSYTSKCLFDTTYSNTSSNYLLLYASRKYEKTPSFYGRMTYVFLILECRDRNRDYWVRRGLCHVTPSDPDATWWEDKSSKLFLLHQRTLFLC